MAFGQRLVEVGLQAVAVPVDDALLEAALDRPVQVLVGGPEETDAPSKSASSSWSGS